MLKCINLLESLIAVSSYLNPPKEYSSTSKRLSYRIIILQIRLGADIKLKDMNARNLLHLVVLNGGRLEEFAASCKVN